MHRFLLPFFMLSLVGWSGQLVRGQPNRSIIEFTSAADGSVQQAYLAVPTKTDQLAPLVVSLHSWSGDLQQHQPELEQLVHERQWFCLQPNFRGVNDHPEALASPQAQQDILDAVDWTLARYPVDRRRIYLTGNSGGGHMTMMMVAKHPHRWTAASAWVGISDLKAWYGKHAETNYGAMMRKACGGAPGASAAVDDQYHQRSPLHFLMNASSVPLDLAAGVHDGHQGSVPVRHSLDAFNVIARANATRSITESEIEQISRELGRLVQPQEGDVGVDPSFGRDFYLRRISGLCRVTIFEGGHEGIATAAMAWFDQHPDRAR